MSKPKLIIISFIIITLIALVTVGLYLLSFKDIVFIVKEPNLTVSIYKSNDDEVLAFFDDDKLEISLQKGDYFYKVSGAKTGEITQDFTIDNDSLEIIIDPDYSDIYLESVLYSEKNNILSVINNSYPTVINDYIIGELALFKKGEWCGVSLSKIVEDRSLSDEYRIILKKENNTWVIVGIPQIVATKYNFPEVPIEVLTLVNDLSIY
jgi:hypothetical protein